MGRYLGFQDGSDTHKHITFILVVNLFGIVGLFMSADSYGRALQEVREIYSPLNVINWLLELVILSPALVAYVWRERRRKSVQDH